MDVTLLGTGDAAGVPPLTLSLDDCNAGARRRRSGLLVETDDQTVLFDAGPDLPEQVRETGIDQLDAVFLTHWHHDHAGGIEELGIVSSAFDFGIYLTETAADHLRTERPHLTGSFEEQTLEHGRTVHVGDLEIVPFPVAHGRPTFDTLGFTVRHGDSTAVYAPDIERFCPDRPGGNAYRNADLLLVEGTAFYRPDIYDADVDFEMLVDDSNADRTVLTHLNEAYLGLSTEEMKQRARTAGYELGVDFATYSM
ncbi:MBL fold metallo-hydrolase [Halomicrobium sp. IBSBa]|uniref:MBL fold metallo-hydrolase n=1 Tax=Halomicrobium sp. IBSBa TaxID=2778916 RepID=UPI001ABFA01F|nr:MBL fold metallo-hydrolase [Halomicrobium sp. IBSBa]MBO4248306.1 MBL fold metallo-hydrolase [Halomicrobium sp. IBSBa]